MINSIKPKDKQLALEILRNSFMENQNLAWMTRANKMRSIKNLCAYCLEVAMIKKGAFITSDKKAVVLAYQQKMKLSVINKIRLWVLYIRLLLTTIDLRRIREISSFYGYVEQFRPKDNYLYCIMLGIQAKERKVQTLFRVRDFLFELSEKTNLELHVQTSIEKVKRIFEKRDFKLCHTVFNPVGKYKLWLLKKA